MGLASALTAGWILSSCRSAGEATGVPVHATALGYGSATSQALPQARIYRTSTDVDALVPVTVDPSTGALVSYPAPTDITGFSMPVVLSDGWLLDRRGINENTRFIDYTYSRYHDLSEAPSPDAILKAIVPDARVTEIVELPYKTGAVTPAQADSLIKAGLPRCETIFKL